MASPTRVVVSSSGPRRVQTAGTPGQRGPRGFTGEKGDEGMSAYEVWLDEGNQGTEQDFLYSLIGGQYAHEQMSPSALWSIGHGLGFFPNVTAFDSSGGEIVGQVQHNDINHLTITFTGATAGEAYLS